MNDGELTSSDSFVLTVNSVNDPPTISSVPPQTIDENTSTETLSFTVSDPETVAGELIVTAASSDTA